MQVTKKCEEAATVREYKHPLEFMADFEGVQFRLDMIGNLMLLYREMLDTDWSHEEEPEPYVMEEYWKRRGLYFSQFAAIEVLFLQSLKEMAEIVEAGYQYCRKARKQGGVQNGE